jgi:hypothetical protein
MSGACSAHGEMCREFRPEGMRPLRRPGRRWEDNIKMDLREIGRDGVNFIRLAQDRDHCRAFCEHLSIFEFLKRQGIS